MKRIRFRVCAFFFAIARRLPASTYRPFPWGAGLRRFFARGLLAHCGRGANIEQGCEIVSPSSVRLGDYSGIGRHAYIAAGVTIGDYVMMAPEVVILTQNHEFADPTVPMARQGARPVQPVVIEDDVWLGQRAMILPGVTVGRGSIVGAGAVVAKSIPPYSIAVGNPARIIRSRMPHCGGADTEGEDA